MAFSSQNSPPLKGIKIVELAGLAPGPFCGLILADFGASVLRVDRASKETHSGPSLPSPTSDNLVRGKRSIALNLKTPAAVSLLLRILQNVDVLIDPFRPGVLESLGLGPDRLLKANPRLIIARLTGFRRDGKYSAMAGHDINYVAVSGILSQLVWGPKGKPSPPMNLLADFAGGGLMCALGILLALFARTTTGKGQVVEENMVDGVAYIGTFIRFLAQTPMASKEPGNNTLDGGSPFYDTYRCKDGLYMAVGALEPQFFTILRQKLGLSEDWESDRYDQEKWPELRRLMEENFLSKSRKDWEAVFNGTDACVTPVLSQTELQDGGNEHRVGVTLSGTPAVVFDQDAVQHANALSPSDGGEQLLQEWFNWTRGQDYSIKDGSLVAKKDITSKL